MPVTTEIRVRYAETDQMSVVYYSNYLVWFEIGRVELMRSLGMAYSQLEDVYGCILPVAEARCRYRASARYDDQIQIETQPALVRASLVKFAYKIWRKASGEKERELLADGETTHMVCDKQMNRMRLPEEHLAALKAMTAAEAPL
jgi:acyl-CoA thioester hydrolase